MNTTPTSPVRPLRRILAFALAVGAGVAGLCAAQPTVVREDHAVVKPELKRADRDFFEKVAKASMDEVQASRVAAERTTNPDVKRLAQMIVSDHQAGNDELASLAAAKGVALPAKDNDVDNKWTKHKAESFDKDYLAKMVDTHQDVVKLFDREARDGNDVDAVTFARKQLPDEQRHLQQALDLKRALK
jgi:putative membrane protein